MRMTLPAIVIVAVLGIAQVGRGAVFATYSPYAPEPQRTLKVSGALGEYYFALKGPELILNRAGAFQVPGATLDNFGVGEVAYLNLGGFAGSVDMGPIVKNGLTRAELCQLRFVVAINFSSDPQEVAPRFVTSIPAFPPHRSFFIVVPEPTGFGVAGMSLLALTFYRARRVRNAILRSGR